MRDLPQRGGKKKDMMVKTWFSEDRNGRCVLKGKGKEPAKTENAEEEEEDGQRRRWNRISPKREHQGPKALQPVRRLANTW